MPPVEDFNAAGETDENYGPYPDGAVTDTDNMPGFLNPAAIAFRSVVVGEGLGIPQTGTTRMVLQTLVMWGTILLNTRFQLPGLTGLQTAFSVTVYLWPWLLLPLALAIVM